MLEAISKMFDSTFPASFINFSFLPKYASYFVDGVLNTLALSIVAVLLAVIPALLLALMRLSKNRFIHGLSGALSISASFTSFKFPGSTLALSVLICSSPSWCPWH